MSDMQEYYKKGHTNYTMEQMSLENLDSRLSNIVEAVKRVTEENGKLLDIGCGDGFLKKALPNFEYQGIDIDNTRFPEAIKHDLAVTPYPVSSESIDTIVCSEVLEHLWEPEKTIKEMFRILKFRGKGIITVPNYNNIDYILDNYRQLIYDKNNPFTVEHIRQYTVPSLSAMFEQNGFEVLSALGNSTHMQQFFAGPRRILAGLMGTDDLTKVDVILGQMFPHYCMGLLLVVSKAVR